MVSGNLEDLFNASFDEDAAKKIEEELKNQKKSQDNQNSFDGNFDELNFDKENIVQSLISGELGEDIGENIKDVFSSVFSAISKSGKLEDDSDSNEFINKEVLKKTATSNIDVKSNKTITFDIKQDYLRKISNASLWIDAQVNLPALSIVDEANVQILRPIDYVESKIDDWISILTPIAKGSNKAMKKTFDSQMSDFAQMRGELPDDFIDNPMALSMGLFLNGDKEETINFGKGVPLNTIFENINKSMLSSQAGNGISKIANTVMFGSEPNIPFVNPKIIMIPANINNLSEKYNLNVEDLIQYVALKEVLSIRLFLSAPWIRGHILSILNAYAEGINLDYVSEKLLGISPDDMAKNFGVENFKMPITKDQKIQILKLRAILSLIESWVDFISFKIASPYIDNTNVIQESLNRHYHDESGPRSVLFKFLTIQQEDGQTNNSFKLWEYRYSHTAPQEAYDEVWAHPDKIAKIICENAEYFGLQEVYSDNFDESSGYDWDSLLS